MSWRHCVPPAREVLHHGAYVEASAPIVASALAVAAVVAGLSGCSSSDAGPREAANLGTRVCILNSWTETVGIGYTIKDSFTRDGPLGPGMQTCGEGTTGVDDDLRADLLIPGAALGFKIAAGNPWLGAPYALLLQNTVNMPDDPESESLNAFPCTSTDGFQSARRASGTTGRCGCPSNAFLTISGRNSSSSSSRAWDRELTGIPANNERPQGC